MKTKKTKTITVLKPVITDLGVKLFEKVNSRQFTDSLSDVRRFAREYSDYCHCPVSIDYVNKVGFDNVIYYFGGKWYDNGYKLLGNISISSFETVGGIF